MKQSESDKRTPPLRGRSILITRAENKGTVLKKNLERRGARVISVPTIRFAPPQDMSPLERALSDINEFHWIIFTSSTAVEFFFDIAREQGVPESAWRQLHFGLVGATTASRLASAGVRGAKLVVAPTASALGHLLLGADEPGALDRSERCLFAHADIGRTDLQDLLREKGVAFESVIVYRTLAEAPEKAQAFFEAADTDAAIDAAVFASPSAFNNFLDMTTPLGDQTIRKRPVPLISIGPTTSQAIRNRGHEVTLEAAPHSSAGLLDAVYRLLCPEFITKEDEPKSPDTGSSESKTPEESV